MSITVGEADDILRTVFPEWVNQLDLRVVETQAHGVVVLMPAAQHILRTGEMVSGQAAMALIDTAMVIALANALGGFKPVGTIDIAFSFMRPMKMSDIVCEVSILQLGSNMAFCRAIVREAGGVKPAIHATATYALPKDHPKQR